MRPDYYDTEEQQYIDDDDEIAKSTPINLPYASNSDQDNGSNSHSERLL